jgi:hypothetical protein
VDTLVVVSWNNDRSWVSDGSWSRSNLAGRLEACTNLRGTELKRIVRRLLAREVMEVPVSSRELAEPAAHVLESMGATVAFQHGTP